MINIKTLGLATTLAMIPWSAQVIAEEDVVNSYLVPNSGGVVTDSSGDCVRTTRKDSMNMLENCGYAKPAPKAKTEITMTPSAVSVTSKVEEEISIAAAILFDFDSAELSDDGKTIIDERISRFSDYKKSNIEIKVVGHTDSTGPEAYNQKLSERRARSVADYIEKMKQTPDTSVEASGMGETQPMAPNDTKDGRATNRRVKIIVTGTVTK